MKIIKSIAMIALAVAVVVFAPEIAGFVGMGLTSATVVAIGLSIGLSAALGLLHQLFAPKPSSTAVAPQTYRQTISNTQIVYGKARSGGLICFYHANKQGTDDYRYFVIAFAGHPITAFTNYYFNDQTVTVDGSGLVTSGKYANNAWIWSELGSPAAASNSNFINETDGMWTASHRGQGIAKLYVKFKLIDAIIAENFPNITAEFQGKNDISDPRTGAKGYTTNAILCAYDWLLLPRADGGFGAKPDEIDNNHIAVQANICDEQVPLKAGGSEPRYTCNGIITTGAAPDDIRDSLLTAFAGEFTYASGFFKFFAGAWRPPLQSLIENDLVAPLQVTALVAGDTIGNTVRGTYNDPRQMYQPQEYPSLDLLTTDDLRSINLDLPFTKSQSMCQRIAKITLRRLAAERAVVWQMNLRGLALEALDVVQLATVRFALSNYTWKIASCSLDANFVITLTVKEENVDFYDWTPATDEQAALAVGATIETPIGILVGSGGGPTKLAVHVDSATQMTVSFTMPTTSSVVGYDVLYSTSASSGSALKQSGNATPGQAIGAIVGGLTTATTYYFWVLARLGTGAYSPTVGPINATTL